MTKEEIVKFCERFMPSYKIYMPNLMKNGLLKDDREVKFYFTDKREPYLLE